MRLLALAALLAAAPTFAAPVEFRFDPDATFVYFEFVHFGTSTLRGRFGPLNGHAKFDAEAGTGEVGITIDTATVDSGTPVFDARLRKADLLNSEGYPHAWFVAREWHFSKDGKPTEIRGEFTLRGESQGMSLYADRFDCHTDDASQREICGGDFHAEFKRSAYGMTFGLPFVADRVRLVVRVEGVRQ
jgi:polyisoprenoid-binding protein YceI